MATTTLQTSRTIPKEGVVRNLGRNYKHAKDAACLIMSNTGGAREFCLFQNLHPEFGNNEGPTS